MVGLGWMEENKKSGVGDVRASNSPSEMAILPLGSRAPMAGLRSVGNSINSINSINS